MIIRGERIDCALGADVPDLQAFEPCPACGGEPLSLGVWAAHIQLRCRACGATYQGPEYFTD